MIHTLVSEKEEMAHQEDVILIDFQCVSQQSEMIELLDLLIDLDL